MIIKKCLTTLKCRYLHLMIEMCCSQCIPVNDCIFDCDCLLIQITVYRLIISGLNRIHLDIDSILIVSRAQIDTGMEFLVNLSPYRYAGVIIHMVQIMSTFNCYDGLLTII